MFEKSLVYRRLYESKPQPKGDWSEGIKWDDKSGMLTNFHFFLNLPSSFLSIQKDTLVGFLTFRKTRRMSEQVKGKKFMTGKQLDKMEAGEEFFVQVFH